MRTISIIGAGPAGLLLANGLVGAGYEVTVYSDRDADAIRSGFAPSSGGLSPGALAAERELGLNFWDDDAEPLEGVHLDVAIQGSGVVATVEGPWGDTGPWQCVDLRLKCASWLAEFERRGGHVVIREMTPTELDAVAGRSDLTVVSTGKGELSGLFKRDDERSTFDQPQRNLSMVIIKNHPGWVDECGFSPLHYTKFLDVGEIFGGAFYNTTEERAHFLIYEAIAGGPIDRFGAVHNADEHLEVSKQIIKDLMPWQWDLVKDAELADAKGAIRGRITPTVRHPIGVLPSGAYVTGLGDTLSLKDPIGGQGANSAIKGAYHMLGRIIDHGDKPFDATWMQSTWEDYWNEYEQYAEGFNNGLMRPLQDFQQELILAAAESPDLAKKMFYCFTHPPSSVPWFVDPVAAREVLAGTAIYDD